MTAADRLAARWDAVMMSNYPTPPITLVRGEGARVWDADGRVYLDLVAGIAVNALGHAHPRLVAAVTEQLGRLGHTSNLVRTAPAVTLAERLVELLGHGPGRVFFANSGAEANEAALKLVRRGAGPTRQHLVAAERGFHGRTMGALSVTGKPAIRDPFAPFGFDVSFVPYGDADALHAAVTDRTAAVFLEAVQGEGGVNPAPAGYLATARAVTRERGALLVLDEVQTGVGRTGAWFAHHGHGLTGVQAPDVVTLAKGLGGGLPIGACVAVGPAATALRPGDHGSTFGGNPVVCAAALAVLDVIESDGLLKHAADLGDRLLRGLSGVEDPLLGGVRGRGLLLAMVLTTPAAAAVEAAARAAGFLVNAVTPDAVRLAPPLMLSQREAETFLAAVPGILAAATGPARVEP